jgi:intracellular sulfur oxidation DsrE/DsrF family protein
MKKIMILLALFALAWADEESVKAVYDLTTADVGTFEKKILKGIAANKSHYEGNLQELEVAVVIHGGAYRFFVNDIKTSKFKDDAKLVSAYAELKKRIASMADTYDVEFLMCGASMPKNGLTKADIPSFVTVVPNASVGLIDRQNEGYAYIPVGD